MGGLSPQHLPREQAPDTWITDSWPPQEDTLLFVSHWLWCFCTAAQVHTKCSTTHLEGAHWLGITNSTFLPKGLGRVKLSG